MARSVRVNYAIDVLQTNPLGSTLQSLGSGIPGLDIAELLIDETFEDSNFTSRGWYDMAGGFTLDSVNPHSGSNSGKFTWQEGNSNTDGVPTGRIKFTATDRVYIEFWTRYSSNYVGSQQAFHPHEWQLITDEDGDFVAPADTHLSISVETRHQAGSGNIVSFGATDNADIDQGNINVDLTAITEDRGAHGCNGLLENSEDTTSCFDRGDQFVADRNWNSPVVITDANKTNWNKLGAFMQLNTITDGSPDLNGILQYWVNDVLEIDHQGVVLRTGKFPNMKFDQLLLAPFIGPGSPVVQTIWYDDLKIAVGKI